MRGGLGKTLLLAFLLLTIFPLSLLAFLTYNQIQHDTRDKMLSSLGTVVALKQEHLEDWIDGCEGQLALVAHAFDPAAGMASWFKAMKEAGSALTGVVVVDVTGDGTRAPFSVVDQVGQVPVHGAEVAALTAAQVIGGQMAGGELVWLEGQGALGNRQQELLPAVCYVGDRWALLGLLSPEALERVVTAQEGFDEGILTSLAAGGPGEGGDVVVISREGTTRLGMEQAKGEAIGQVLAGARGMGAYKDLAGEEVFGAYGWSAELGVGLVAERRQVEALAAGDEVTALVVAATLGAALLSAAMAAVVTRRVTRPIVELTETAAWLARGDLNQQVAVTRKDEIGVLARAFNRMAAELRLLYGSLEAKVEERTLAWRETNEALEKANEYTRYYVMQLAISAEVARVAAAIRDLEVMLETVVELIGRAFELHYVAIYLVDETGEWAVWEVGTGGAAPAECRVAVGGPTLVGRAACPPSSSPPEGGRTGDEPLTGERIEDGPLAGVRIGEEALVAGTRVGGARERVGGKIEKAVRPDGGWELAVPLCVRGRVLGVLALESLWKWDKEEATGRVRRAGWVPESDWLVYQSLADQISIAIENTRAYAVERETVQRLRELDRIQAEFLTNMSHALRTPLNSVIGFSRVMLKELDGPLTEMQQADLTTIYEAGRQLLGLLNDMLDLSQLEVGAVSWSPPGGYPGDGYSGAGEVDLSEVIEGVMATTHALARNKPIQLRSEVADVLPTVYTDGQRVRQVILALLSNAVKFTEAGTITLRANSSSPSTPQRSRPQRAEGRGEAAARHSRYADSDEVTISVTIQGTESEAGIASLWGQGAAATGAGADGNGQVSPTGFGLAVSKRVVAGLGGKIRIDRRNEGLVLTFTLPVLWEKGNTQEAAGDE